MASPPLFNLRRLTGGDHRGCHGRQWSFCCSFFLFFGHLGHDGLLGHLSLFAFPFFSLSLCSTSISASPSISSHFDTRLTGVFRLVTALSDPHQNEAQHISHQRRRRSRPLQPIWMLCKHSAERCLLFSSFPPLITCLSI
jgi:hypothetical protein